ncbi:hypothetical protein JXM67_03765, partial [candidate division WOR-3 bacterium]|nr:hypothetical protein [candidate division WOR-3 bacterium]
LPMYVPLPNRNVMLADIMIRDMLATNSGRVYTDRQKISVEEVVGRQNLPLLAQVGLTGKTRIPAEYIAPIKVFKDSVLAGYKDGVMPIFFSTTVRHELIQDYAPALLQEGLTYRFVRIPDGPIQRPLPALDVERTYRLFTDEFQMTSILDPKVRKEEQTRGLFVNYGLAIQAITDALVAMGQPQKAYDFVKVIDQFEMDAEVRGIFLRDLYVVALEAGIQADAARYAEELKTLGYSAQQLQRLPVEYYMRLGVVHLGQGELTLAEQILQKAYNHATREYPDPFHRLVTYYVEIGDTAKASQLVAEWDSRYPGDPLTFQMYLNYLNKPRAALEVLDRIIRDYPDEPELLQVRDSLKSAYNL